MNLRVIIVDDEPLARERVRLLLRNESDVEILGECGSGPEAIDFIQKESPDLLFLDVQMPVMDGFAVLRSLPPDKLPLVIFATAYDQHALRAFDAHALDYLLKPFKPTRFKEALQRARQQLANKQTGLTAKSILDLLGQQPAPARSQYITRLTVKTDDKVLIIKTTEIDSIESAGNYVALHVGKENHILRETLSALEKQLDPDKFLRVSRSAIVNLEAVKELQPGFKGDHIIVLHKGRTIHMTRGLREVEKALRFS